MIQSSVTLLDMTSPCKCSVKAAVSKTMSEFFTSGDAGKLVMGYHSGTSLAYLTTSRILLVLSAWVTEFVKREELPEITIHSSQHNNFTLLIAAGIPIKDCRKLRGNAQTSTRKLERCWDCVNQGICT